MLPMFETADQLRRFLDLVDGELNDPLSKLPKQLPISEKSAQLKVLPSSTSVYLNDLHIGLGMKFMFELLIDGTIQRMAAFCRQTNIAFGFGGMARMDEG